MASNDYMDCEGCGAKLIYDVGWYSDTAGKVIAGLCPDCQSRGWKLILRSPRRTRRKKPIAPDRVIEPRKQHHETRT